MILKKSWEEERRRRRGILRTISLGRRETVPK
jgi:hypothetical protein